MINDWDFRTAARTLNIALVPFPEDQDCRGVSRARELALRPGEPHPVFVGVHEMAHIVLGHTTLPGVIEAKFSGKSDTRIKQEHEIEAHTVAILVAEKLQLIDGIEWEEEAEIHYVYHNGGHNEAGIADHVLANADKIRSAAQIIVAAGLPQGVSV